MNYSKTKPDHWKKTPCFSKFDKIITKARSMLIVLGYNVALKINIKG